MIAAGEDIDSYCGKCRLNLAHVVIAAEKGRAKRVQCKTCGSPHNHRAPEKSSTRAAKAPAAKRAPRANSARGYAQRFEEAIEGRDVARAKRYSPDLTLTHGDVIDHAKFGLGVVGKVSGDNKAQIAFRDAERVLICNRT